MAEAATSVSGICGGKKAAKEFWKELQQEQQRTEATGAETLQTMKDGGIIEEVEAACERQ